MTQEAKLSDVQDGTVLAVDGGFTCMKAGAHKIARKDPAKGFYVKCSSGRHYLDGQLREDGSLAGMTMVVP